MRGYIVILSPNTKAGWFFGHMCGYIVILSPNTKAGWFFGHMRGYIVNLSLCGHIFGYMDGFWSYFGYMVEAADLVILLVI